MTRLLLVVFGVLVASHMTSSVSMDLGDCGCMCGTGASSLASSLLPQPQNSRFFDKMKGVRGDIGPNGGYGTEGVDGLPGKQGIRGLPAPGLTKIKDNSPTSCKDLYDSGTTRSGVYTIRPAPFKPKAEVFCDMQSAGGGWTLVASVHENNIDGKCTTGDNWSSDQGTNGTSLRNWENFKTFGLPEAATSMDYKSSAYFDVQARDVMVWHVSNDVTIDEWRANASLQYHTTNGFLSSYGGNLQVLFKKYFPMRRQVTNSGQSVMEQRARSLEATLARVRGGLPGFYEYSYDMPASQAGQSHIVDGGHDMYDRGNQIFYSVGDGEYQPIRYNTSYRDTESGVQFFSLTTYPFIALMWVANPNGYVDRFGLKVTSGTGADNSGNHVSYRGSLSSDGMTCAYHSFVVYNANDPSIGEVYFSCSDPARWRSAPGDFVRSSWSSTTDNLNNAVYTENNPQNILMGYTLLSIRPGTVISENDVQRALRTLISGMSRFQAVPDIDCSRENETVAVPVNFIKGSASDVMSGIPRSQRSKVDASFVQFRAVDIDGNPYALCPAVRSRSCQPQALCVGGLAGEGRASDNSDSCGDFGGWSQPDRSNRLLPSPETTGVPYATSTRPFSSSPDQTDQPNQLAFTEPSTNGRSLRDINSAILIFTR